jgi:polyisoprenyl-teichoic acid--peptidoglycan teichoic acid transferase
MAQEKAPVNEVRFPATEAKNPAVDSYLYVKDSDLRKTFDEFMTGEGSSNPRRLDETTKPKATATPERTKKKNKKSSVEGLEQARTEGENMALIVASENKLKFPFYFPSLRKTGSRYADPEPRVYSIRDGEGKLHRAYRLTLNAGSWSEYYGVQGTTWRNPPILDDPDRVREVDGRKLELFYDGSRIRLVSWRTSKAVYWVTNTLTLSIPNSRLIAMAGSLRRLK